MAEYTVRPGDCLHSIAFERGLYWETIWRHPQNAALRERRQEAHVVHPGDRIFIPERNRKEESRMTDQHHRFRRKGVPANLRLQLMDHDRPRADLPYVLEIDGDLRRGTTDGEGWIRCAIPPNARRGTLTLGEDQEERYELNLGHIDPVEEIAGVQERLNNLGFGCGRNDGQLGERTRTALRAFQAKHELPVSGEPDQATRDKLLRIYDQ